MKEFDKVAKEFIDKELESISANKEAISAEKVKVRKRKFELSSNYDEHAKEEKNEYLLLEQYEAMLCEQYNLLCRRDIAIFQFIAKIVDNLLGGNSLDGKIHEGMRLVLNGGCGGNSKKVRTIVEIRKHDVVTDDDAEIEFSVLKSDYIILPPAEKYY